MIRQLITLNRWIDEVCMLKIKVEKNGGDYSVIQEAIDAVPYDESAVIEIGTGVYREKIFCEKKDITLVGAGMAETVIDHDDYANEVMPDGSKRGTFRTYTAFFGGKKVTVRDMTIRNSAGDGRVVGQAVAVYADADVCRFEKLLLVASTHGRLLVMMLQLLQLQQLLLRLKS